VEKRNLTLKSSGSGTKDFRLDGKVAIVTGGGSAGIVSLFRRSGFVTGADYPLDGGFFNLRG
jgi:hypothetical protein